MKLFLFFVVLTVTATIATIATAITDPKINFKLLRDEICAFETQGIKNPDFAVGLIVKQRGGLPWGRCQIKYWTAVKEGFSINRNPGDLFLEHVSKEFSLKILKGCAKDIRRKGIIPTVRRVSECYGAGTIRRVPKSWYSKSIRVRYSTALHKLNHNQLMQIREWSQTTYTLAVIVEHSKRQWVAPTDTIFDVFFRPIRLFLARIGFYHDTEMIWGI